MIRRIGLSLALMAVVAAPVMAQPPAPPTAVPPRPSVIQFDPAQSPDQQGGQRGFGRRNRGDGQGFGNPGGGRGLGRIGGPGAAQNPGGATQAQATAPVAAAVSPNPAAAPQGRGPAARPAGPPAPPADALVMRSLQGSISAVFDPGAKSARIKLIETDDHGVEGLRTLKPGDLYRDGWRLSAVTATEATLRKGKSLLHVDITRGWPAPSPIQPAVLVQPIVPPTPAGGRRGPAVAPGRGVTPAAPGLGLSNARAGGSPPAPARPGVAPSMTIQSPNGPISIQTNPDGSRTMTTNVNGQRMVMTIQPGQ